MAIVTEIKEFKGIITLSLDGVTWLKVRKKHFDKLPLEPEQELDSEEYIDRMAAIQSADCYEAALTMLDQAAQTSSDLCRKLVRKGYVAPAAEATVARLTENRLIDDRRYAERIAQMKPTALLINTARGPVVDSQALADALNEGRIAGAGIDVFEMEPPVPRDHPLLSAKNVIATPHVAFATQQSMEKRAVTVCENLRAWLDGEQKNVIC